MGRTVSEHSSTGLCVPSSYRGPSVGQPFILIPSRPTFFVQTRIGTLEFKDGAQGKATLKRGVGCWRSCGVCYKDPPKRLQKGPSYEMDLSGFRRRGQWVRSIMQSLSSRHVL